MSRFTRINWCAFVLILALAFSSVGVVVSAVPVHAADIIDDPHGGGPGGGGSAGYGDPDVPTGVAKQSLPLNSGRRVVVGSARVAGDGAELDSLGMWRIQTLMLLARSYFFRF